jgi:D-alanyl-D-alanine carboxypeptidase
MVVIDESHLERLLRSRPLSDATYQPVVADLLDPPTRHHAIGTGTRWRGSTTGRPHPVAWIVVLVALLVALVVALSVGRQAPDLVESVTPQPSVLIPAAPPMFPTLEANALADAWKSTWRPSVAGGGAFQGDKVAAALAIGGRVWGVEARVSAGSPARIGAASRLYLVSIVLQLIDEGRLALDTPVSRFVPAWPGGEGITVQNLLDGSSGVASFGEPIEDLSQAIAADRSRNWTAADALRISRVRPERFATGSRHEPVDTEDALLVAIVESVTGEPYLDSFVTRLQDPLTLRTTYASGQKVPHEAGHGDVMWGYWDPADTGKLVEARDLPDGVVAVLGPARGMASPVLDLARANDALFTDSRWLSQSARGLLGEPIEEGGVLGSAMCPCRGSSRQGIGVIGHMGAYTTMSVHVPTEGLSIVIVVNRTVPDDELEHFVQELHDVAWPALR